MVDTIHILPITVGGVHRTHTQKKWHVVVIGQGFDRGNRRIVLSVDALSGIGPAAHLGQGIDDDQPGGAVCVEPGAPPG